ncbi:MAG: hypothetical protein A2W74_05870 [Planctomycetes bacterium RIFCSPLOWO2_12_38_17]|nr:MAG: hypothetical protein A2W74_05870 [Planctomycetes bacterium RIFCSPLOWO2_12_38_17]
MNDLSPMKRLLNIIVEKTLNHDERFCPVVVAALREYTDAVERCVINDGKWHTNDTIPPL